MTYNELINSLKRLPTKKEQVGYLMGYLLTTLTYDYTTLEICHFDPKLLDFIDDNFDPKSEESRIKAIELVRRSGYSEDFIKRILEHYGETYIFEERPARVIMGRLQPYIPEHTEYRKFSNAFSMTQPQVLYKDEIITKGVCANFSEFVKKVCDQLEIPCLKIKGRTSVGHVWNAINIDGSFKHYDLTYAIFARDHFNGWEKTTPSDWFEITAEKLLELQPNRIIETFPIDEDLK